MHALAPCSHAHHDGSQRRPHAATVASDRLIATPLEGARRRQVDDARVRPPRVQQRIKAMLDEMSTRFPQKRGDRVSEAYTALLDLIRF